jgi:APA family basic amino acid/polyamine antiporter
LNATAASRPLLRILGLGFALAAVLNAAIGGGILRVPGAVAAELGNAWLILGMWGFGGLFAMLVANSYAEMATMLPRAGGPYVYARRAFGEYAGFLIGWVDWFVNVAAMAFLSIAFGEFFVLLLPALSPYQNWIGPVLLVGLASMHLTGLRSGNVAQQLLGFIKVSAFLLVIGACLAAGPAPVNSFNSTVAHTPLGAFALGVLMVRGFQLVFETYDGWYAAVFFSEEDTNPGRNIPRALFGGILVVTAIYVLVNLALLLLLPLDVLTSSTLPLAAAAHVALGESAGKFVTAVALLSLLGILNCKMMYVPRELFALSRDGLFANAVARVSAGGTPDLAMAITLIVALLLAATGSFEALFAAVATLSFVIDMSVHASLFKMRRDAPEHVRPFRAVAYPWFPGLALAAGIGFFCAFIFANPASGVRALIPLALSYPLYRLCAWRNRPTAVSSFR